MPTLTLPFGEGLDRYTGVMAVQPGSMRNLINVRPFGQKLHARRGTTLACNLPDRGGVPCSAVLLIQAIQSEQQCIILGYYKGERKSVHIFRAAGDATDPFPEGKLLDLDDRAADPPRFVSAESYGKAFIAHDEPLAPARSVTKVFDANTGDIEDLTMTVNDEEQDIRFRGVEEWRNYMVGWGFGIEGQGDSPEIVRVSLPGQPTVFRPDHYFIAGDRGSEVTAVKTAGENLLVFKATQTFRIVGTSQFDFGILPVYQLSGALSARLAINVEGACFLWGHEGPWATSGADFSDLEPAIELERPAPADLPSSVEDPQNAFAVYVPRDRVIEWHWGRRIYCLHVGGEGPRWSYRVRGDGATTYAGNLLYTGSGLVGDIAGRPELVGVATVSSGRVKVTWNNENHDGNENVEIWLRLAPFSGADLGGLETVGGVFPIDHPTGWFVPQGFNSIRVSALSQQSVEIPDLAPLGNYDIAIRYRRGGRYHSAYPNGQQGSWPATARDKFTVEIVRAPTIADAVWLRTARNKEQVRLLIEPHEDGERWPHTIIRDGQEIGELEAGETQYVDEDIIGEIEVVYKVVARGFNDVTSDDVTVYTGPPTLEDFEHRQELYQDTGQSNSECYYLITDIPTTGIENVIEVEIAGENIIYATHAAHRPREGKHTVPCNDNNRYRARYVVTTHQTLDFSQWIDARFTRIFL